MELSIYALPLLVVFWIEICINCDRHSLRKEKKSHMVASAYNPGIIWEIGVEDCCKFKSSLAPSISLPENKNKNKETNK